MKQSTTNWRQKMLHTKPRAPNQIKIRVPLPIHITCQSFDLYDVFCVGANEQMFNEYLLKINKELTYVQFELRACRNQYDGRVYYGVVNNVSDEQSKLGSKYSVPQIAFYKAVVPSSSQSQLGSQSDVPAALRNFSMSQKEKTLEELVHDGWLTNLDGSIGFGVRSFLDLRSWFRNNEISACDVCNEAGVKAELCPNNNCTVRIHKYCLIKKFSQIKVQKVCPGCNTPWPFVVPKAELVEELNETIETHRSSEPSQKKRRRNSQSQTPGSDTAGSGSSQAGTLRRSSRLR